MASNDLIRAVTVETLAPLLQSCIAYRNCDLDARLTQWPRPTRETSPNNRDTTTLTRFFHV